SEEEYGGAGDEDEGTHKEYRCTPGRNDPLPPAPADLHRRTQLNRAHPFLLASALNVVFHLSPRLPLKRARRRVQRRRAGLRKRRAAEPGYLRSKRDDEAAADE